jgi:2-oxoisovalerate dehydrogenase E1 component
MTTAFSTPIISERLSAARAAGLDPEALIRAFRLMQTSRRIDDREILLKRQNKIFFQISCAGHEAIQVAAGMATRRATTGFSLLSRPRALPDAGHDALRHAAAGGRRGDDPSSGGRQMPSHWADPAKNIVSPVRRLRGRSSCRRSGCAEGCRILPPSGRTASGAGVSSGEGATSEGEFWESINQACLNRAPVLFLIQDNGFAISVPVERQTPGGSISKLMAGFPDLLTIEVDGTDLISSYRAMSAAAAWCREGHGPALVHAHCVRPYSHSLSDDERNYKTKHEREEEARAIRCALSRSSLWKKGILDARTGTDHARDRSADSRRHASRAEGRAAG